MAERVLADCTGTGNCPELTDLGDGRIAVTGSLPDGTETTVTVPVEVFDAAARAWLRLADRAVEAGCVGDG